MLFLGSYIPFSEIRMLTERSCCQPEASVTRIMKWYSPGSMSAGMGIWRLASWTVSPEGMG